jgi:Holliday junction resolvasome RuvABC ATP-dependent DNA helicase subunit
VLDLLDGFIDQFKEEGADAALEQFLDVAKTRFSGDVAELSAVEAAVIFFAEQFRRLAPVDTENAVRAWRCVFESNRAHWQTLSADLLANLLGPGEKQPGFARFTLSSGSGIQLFEIGENLLIVRDRNEAAPAIHSEFEFNQVLVTQAAQAAVAGTPWRLFARVNTVSYRLANPLPTGNGPHAYDIRLPNEGKQTLRFFVGRDNDNEKGTSKTMTLWECCQDFPFILASSHAKVRTSRRKRVRDEQGNIRYEVEQDITLPSQGRVALHGFVYRLQGSMTVLFPGETIPKNLANLQDLRPSPCKEFALNVDVVEGSELGFAWSDGSGTLHQATISFEFRGEAGPRDDSLTGLLLRAHAGQGGKALKDLLASIKNGHALPRGDFPVRETGKPIAALEQRQQALDDGWWPILVSEGTELLEQVSRLQDSPNGYFRRSPALKLNEQANAWRNIVESSISIGPVPPEVATYVSTRAKVLATLAQQFSLASGELIDEVRLGRTSVVGLLDEQLLTAYLEAYVGLLAATTAGSLPLLWRWHAWCMDCVLIFASDTTGPTANLLGPFHPVTLARLFFVQRCLAERLLDDWPSTLAHVFAQGEPLALGHVLDAQLQPIPAIAFPTGELHWLWLYRQQTQSTLPEDALVRWMRECGLDPQAGPLGVDAEILPQTLRQYILAYPSHQTLRLLLEDCSQRVFEVLRDELSPNESPEANSERLRAKLPGGVSVYDPVAKVKAVDGELLSYDPELTLRWHHAKSPATLPMDVATLSRSNRVDLQRSQRGGVCSAVVPTARRHLVQVGFGGLEVASILACPAVGNDLPSATLKLLTAFEPTEQQLSWGTSLAPTADPGANWTLCSAGQVDPRLFIEYVRSRPGTALWTYRLFSMGNAKAPEFGLGHFLIARVSPSLATSLRSLMAGIGLTVSPEELLGELAQAGLTLGDEFLRTGRTAEGALGQYLVERLVWQPAGSNSALPHWTSDAAGVLQSAGFLLQVDPFNEVLSSLQLAPGARTPQTTSRQRSDLVSVHLLFCGDELWIRPVVIESKLLLAGQPDIENALAQAGATATQFDRLLELCLHDAAKPHPAFWAQPERLLLAELIHLGLRLASGSFTGSRDEWHSFEQRVLTKVLSGDFRRDNAQALAVVHQPGASTDRLLSSQPHASVSFTDANAAHRGTPQLSFQGIQQTLARILRHVCGQQPQIVPSPPQPVVAAPIAQAPSEPSIERPASTPTIEPPRPAPPVKGHTPAEEITRAHETFERAFSDFIGNRQAIDKLRDDLVYALIQHPPHLPNAYLLTGNPSTGKTTIANKVAKLLGVTFVKLVGTNIRNEADLIEQVDNAFRASDKQPKQLPAGTQGIPEHEYPECLIFIDEIHLVKGRAQEGLLTLTEPKDRYVRLRDRICRFPRATYMAATTRDSEIDRALRTRFGNPVHLNDYTVAEVTQMLRVKSHAWAEWPISVCEGIARLARCIPREAERLAQKLERKLKVSREPLTLEQALERLRVEEGLDRNGLDRLCWDALRLLAKEPRPIGRERLAQRLGVVDEEKLVTEIIPSLQSLGLIEQMAGGQTMTDRGRNYLRNEAPPQQG